MNETTEILKLAKAVLAGDHRDVLDILKWKGIAVKNDHGDTDYIWIDFRSQRDAKEAESVLVDEGYDARQHAFKKDSVLVQF